MQIPERQYQEILAECIRQTQQFFLENKTRNLYKHILDCVEKPLIEMVLEKTDGNQRKAATILGINRNTLHAKIKKLGIDISRFKFDY